MSDKESRWSEADEKLPDVVDELINHALPLIEALKPFAKL